MQRPLIGILFFAAVVSSFPGATPCAAALSSIEARCAATLARGALRVARTYVRATLQCLDAAAKGKAQPPCPDAAGEERIATIAQKLSGDADKHCASTCSVSAEVSCVFDAQCPPLAAAAEVCNAGGTRIFDASRLGFPGPLCAERLAEPMQTAADLAECTRAVSREAAETFVRTTHGGAAVPPAARACWRNLARSAAKIFVATARGVSRCRNAINKGKRLANPDSCRQEDGSLARKLAKLESKLGARIESACDADELALLDLCGAGIGGVASVDEAARCLAAAARELADSNVPPTLRAFGKVSLREAAYPPRPVCGDGVINQAPGAFLPLGEECDGADDAACPGQCLPPGDLFECTCANRLRVRFFADASASEVDAGWTGLSHNQEVSDLSGYVTDLANCDCDAFTEATCTGTSADPVCDSTGRTMPRCAWNLGASERCDANGNGNGVDEDADCFVCDENSMNAGVFCRSDGDCQSQCYDAADRPVAACDAQTDCPPATVCRGRCDRTPRCVQIPNGGPLPVNAAGSAVCAVQRFRTDISGTRNIVTGEHALSYRLFSDIHLAERTTRPCPVCGGFCVGGSRALEVCKGRCRDSGAPCRFDADCTAGDRCERASPDCPGGHCELSLVCGADPAINPQVLGKPCRIEFEHPLFGTVSSDCLPAQTSKITGRGLEIDYLPATSEPIVLPSVHPCTAPGFELYDCPCPDAGGQPTQPNTCRPACNAEGPWFGQGCADGAGGGEGTVCAGGDNDGRLCDDDSDCPGGLCGRNPTHCIGDARFERFPCSTDLDCGLGLCVDACPGGRCVPLCVASAQDATEGVCAAGPPVFRCAAAAFAFKSCAQESVAADCQATCSGNGAPCAAQHDCPAGQTCAGPCESHRDCEAGADGVLGTGDDLPGAGACIAAERPCFLDPVTAEGGSTNNGRGDPTNFFTATAFCSAASVNQGVNAGSGFGGPVRIRVRGVNVPNF